MSLRNRGWFGHLTADIFEMVWDHQPDGFWIFAWFCLMRIVTWHKLFVICIQWNCGINCLYIIQCCKASVCQGNLQKWIPRLLDCSVSCLACVYGCYVVHTETFTFFYLKSCQKLTLETIDLIDCGGWIRWTWGWGMVEGDHDVTETEMLKWLTACRRFGKLHRDV